MNLEQIRTLIKIIGFVSAAITALFNLDDEIKYLRKISNKGGK